jgi:hypothetical protein
MARATSSLPTPVSPHTSTVTSARAACSITCWISRICGLTSRASSRCSRSPFSSAGAAGAASRRGRATTARMAFSRSSAVYGRRMKSSAPAWMASTIWALWPGSAIMMIGPDSDSSGARRTSSMPDMPGRRMAMSENTTRVRPSTSSASSALPAARGL